MRKNSIKNTRINGEVRRELCTDYFQGDQRPKDPSDDQCGGG